MESERQYPLPVTTGGPSYPRFHLRNDREGVEEVGESGSCVPFPPLSTTPLYTRPAGGLVTRSGARPGEREEDRGGKGV